jgi:hypothetical protein
MRHPSRHLMADLIVLTVAAYLQAMVLVRCAGSLVARAPWVPSGSTEAEPVIPRAPDRGVIRVVAAPPTHDRCGGISLSIASELSDRAASLVSLRGAAGGSPKLLRAGDRFGELELLHVGTDPTTGHPTAYLSGRRGLCQVSLFAAAQPPAAAETPIVERSLRDRLLANPRSLLAGARVVPEPGGKALRVEWLATGSLLASLGLVAGDRVLSVNGYEIARSEVAIAAYGALSRAERWIASIERDGRRIELEARLP